MFPVGYFPVSTGGGGDAEMDPTLVADVASLKQWRDTIVPEAYRTSTTAWSNLVSRPEVQSSIFLPTQGQPGDEAYENELLLTQGQGIVLMQAVGDAFYAPKGLVNDVTSVASQVNAVDRRTTFEMGMVITDRVSQKRYIVHPLYPPAIVPYPTHEFLTQDAFFIGYSPQTNTFSGWRDSVTQDPKYDWNFGLATQAAYTTQPAIEFPDPAKHPLGIRLLSNQWMANPGLFWPNKGTMFLVYTWVTAPTAVSLLISSRTSPGTVHPNYHWSRRDFQQFTSSSSYTYNSPQTYADSVVRTPYVVGLSWDNTVNPPRITVCDPQAIAEHRFNASIGQDESVRLDYGSPNQQGAEIARVKGHATVFDADLLIEPTNQGNRLTVMGRPSDASNPDRIVHYLGIWRNTYMNWEMMTHVRERLRQRYCVGPFSYALPPGINDAPTVAPVVLPETDHVEPPTSDIGSFQTE